MIDSGDDNKDQTSVRGPRTEIAMTVEDGGRMD